MSILPLPCGCIDASSHIVGEPCTDGTLIVPCRWCGATFDVFDLDDWFSDLPMTKLLMPGRAGRAVVQLTVGTFEVVGRCECGGPSIRPLLRGHGVPQLPPACARGFSGERLYD